MLRCFFSQLFTFLFKFGAVCHWNWLKCTKYTTTSQPIYLFYENVRIRTRKLLANQRELIQWKLWWFFERNRKFIWFNLLREQQSTLPLLNWDVQKKVDFCLRFPSSQIKNTQKPLCKMAICYWFRHPRTFCTHKYFTLWL